METTPLSSAVLNGETKPSPVVPEHAGALLQQFPVAEKERDQSYKEALAKKKDQLHQQEFTTDTSRLTDVQLQAEVEKQVAAHKYKWYETPFRNVLEPFVRHNVKEALSQQQELVLQTPSVLSAAETANEVTKMQEMVNATPEETPKRRHAEARLQTAQHFSAMYISEARTRLTKQKEQTQLSALPESHGKKAVAKAILKAYAQRGTSMTSVAAGLVTVGSGGVLAPVGAAMIAGHRVAKIREDVKEAGSKVEIAAKKAEIKLRAGETVPEYRKASQHIVENWKKADSIEANTLTEKGRKILAHFGAVFSPLSEEAKIAKAAAFGHTRMKTATELLQSGESLLTDGTTNELLKSSLEIEERMKRHYISGETPESLESLQKLQEKLKNKLIQSGKNQAEITELRQKEFQTVAEELNTLAKQDTEWLQRYKLKHQIIMGTISSTGIVRSVVEGSVAAAGIASLVHSHADALPVHAQVQENFMQHLSQQSLQSKNATPIVSDYNQELSKKVANIHSVSYDQGPVTQSLTDSVTNGKLTLHADAGDAYSVQTNQGQFIILNNNPDHMLQLDPNDHTNTVTIIGPNGPQTMTQHDAVQFIGASSDPNNADSIKTSIQNFELWQQNQIAQGLPSGSDEYVRQGHNLFSGKISAVSIKNLDAIKQGTASSVDIQYEAAIQGDPAQHVNKVVLNEYNPIIQQPQDNASITVTPNVQPNEAPTVLPTEIPQATPTPISGPINIPPHVDLPHIDFPHVNLPHVDLPSMQQVGSEVQHIVTNPGIDVGLGVAGAFVGVREIVRRNKKAKLQTKKQSTNKNTIPNRGQPSTSGFPWDKMNQSIQSILDKSAKKSKNNSGNNNIVSASVQTPSRNVPAQNLTPDTSSRFPNLHVPFSGQTPSHSLPQFPLNALSARSTVNLPDANISVYPGSQNPWELPSSSLITPLPEEKEEKVNIPAFLRKRDNSGYQPKYNPLGRTIPAREIITPDYTNDPELRLGKKTYVVDHKLEEFDFATYIPDRLDENKFILDYEIGSGSDRGIRRRSNKDEDSYAVEKIMKNGQEDGALLILANGVGGHSNGADASNIIVEQVNIYFQDFIQTMSPDKALVEATKEANKVLYNKNQSMQTNMGSTLVMAYLDKQGNAYFSNVGDSRGVIVRANSNFEQITQDHSTVAELYRNGIVRREAIYTHPKRSEIYRGMGEKPNIDVDVFSEKLTPGDQVLLYCDGLWEMTQDDTGTKDKSELGSVIKKFAASTNEAKEKVRKLISYAMQQGGDDNVTVIAARLQKPEEVLYTAASPEEEKVFPVINNKQSAPENSSANSLDASSQADLNRLESQIVGYYYPLTSENKDLLNQTLQKAMQSNIPIWGDKSINETYIDTKNFNGFITAVNNLIKEESSSSDKTPSEKVKRDRIFSLVESLLPGPKVVRGYEVINSSAPYISLDELEKIIEDTSTNKDRLGGNGFLLNSDDFLAEVENKVEKLKEKKQITTNKRATEGAISPEKIYDPAVEPEFQKLHEEWKEKNGTSLENYSTLIKEALTAGIKSDHIYSIIESGKNVEEKINALIQSKTKNLNK